MGITHPTLHGLGLSENDGASRFRFAVARFVLEFSHAAMGPLGSRPGLPPWPDRWVDKIYHGAAEKLVDTIYKIDTVASWFERALQQARDDFTQLRSSFSTTNELSIHLDMLLIYLRILADCIANITPNFYGKSMGGKIARTSFRDHRKWFIAHREADPIYSDLLRDQSEWFDLLSAKGGQGLREAVIHNRGTYQIAYTADPSQPMDIRPGLIADRHWVSSNLVPELRAIVAGLCLFLDSYVEHFSDLLYRRIGWRPLDFSIPWHSELYRFEDSHPSSWLFPTTNRLR